MLRSRCGTYILAMITLLFFMVSGLVFWPQTAWAGGELTLEEAIAKGEKSDLDLRKAELTVEQLQIQRDKAAEKVTFIPMGGMVLPAVQTVVNAWQQLEISLAAAKKSRDLQQELTTKNIVNAYVGVMKAKNTLDTARLNLEYLKKQVEAKRLSYELGLLSASDWQALGRALTQAEEGVKAAEASYKTACLTLNELIGADKNAEFALTSRPLLETVKKDSLDTEFSRVLADSILVLQAESQLKIEQSKQNWVLMDSSGGIVPSDLQKNQLAQAEVNYEQAKRSARQTIEGLYYGLEALERQVAAAKVDYEQKKENLRLAEMRYRLGLLPLVAGAGGQDLMAARLEEQRSRATLENLKADLAATKATFYYLTGRKVYDGSEWSAGPGVVEVGLNTTTPVRGKAVFAVGRSTFLAQNREQSMDVAPYIKNGRTYVPVRYLAEALGAKVDWDPARRLATLTKGDTRVELAVEDANICVNGKYTTMDVKPEVVNGRMMLPARYVAEAFGALVSWNGSTREVVLFL